jgi:transcriptional regulator with XRE-family HTH domain
MSQNDRKSNIICRPAQASLLRCVGRISASMSAKKEPNVGVHIRAVRERRGFSLRALAERCGLSINAISRIERGENSPTVSSLHLLAHALEVPITDFFMYESEQSVVLVRSTDRLLSQRDGMVIESLGAGLRQQVVQPFLITLAPGAGTSQDPVTHPGQEFVYVLEGEVAYHVGDSRYDLDPGDSLLFEAAQPHWLENTAETPALVLMTFNGEKGASAGQQRHLST